MNNRLANNKNKLVIVGAGGHARVVASVLDYHSEWEVVGVADRNESNLNEIIYKYRIITTWDRLYELRKQGINHAVLAIGDNKEREEMFYYVKELGFTVTTLIHPTAFTEKSILLGEGTLVCAGVVLSTEVKVGENSIINTGALVDHETKIGNHVHVGPGVVISGRVDVGDYSFLGVGTRVIDKIKIGRNVVAGAGSVVINNIPNNVTVAGVPARVISAA